MDATIKLKNKPNIIGASSNFTYLWGINSGLNDSNAIKLAIAVSEIITDVVLFAFLEQEGELDLSFQRHSDRVEVIIHELGEPFNPDRYEYQVDKAIKFGNFEGAGFLLIKELTDGFLYINKGKQGKEYRLTKYITADHITELVNELNLKQQVLIVPRNEQYQIDIITDDDAENISKLIFRTYGLTYHKDSLYFPKRIALAIQQKEKFGVIAYSSTREPSGYFAIVMSTASNVGEVGEAVVAQKHRRRGLMTKMLSLLVEEAERKGLNGLFGEANAAHIFSQKTNAKFNFKSSAILVGMSIPMKMTGVDKKYWKERMNAVFDFLVLKRKKQNQIYLPIEYESVLRLIYSSLDLFIEEAEKRPLPQTTGVSDIEIIMNYDEKMTLLVVKKYGEDFENSLRQITKDLKNNKMEVLYIDLPLDQEETRFFVPLLKRLQFIFSGLMPMLHQENDYFRMQRLNVPMKLNLLHVYSDNAKMIKKIIVQEYNDLYAEK